jgi:hypothetical protein
VRWTPLSGLAFVVSFLVAVALFGAGAGSRPAEITAYYASHADRLRQIAGFYVLGVGVLFFLWFANVLCRRLEAPLILAAGSLTGALLLAADALWAATAVTVQHESRFVLDPSTHLVFEDAGFTLFLAAMLGSLAFVIVTSAAILRTRALPRTVGLVGFPVAASLAAAWYYVPVFALLGWTAALSLMLAFPLSRPRRALRPRA